MQRFTSGASERPHQDSWRRQQGDPAFHLWKLALTSAPRKEGHSPGALVPTASQIAIQFERDGVVERGLQNGFRIRNLTGISWGGGWGGVHTLLLAMPGALLWVLATSPTYLPFALQGPESLRPSSLLFSCPHQPWCLAFSPPRRAMRWNTATQVLPLPLATLGSVEVQRAQTWRVPYPPEPPFTHL